MTKTLMLAGAALTIAACQQNDGDQNIMVTNNMVNADIEALPPDESVTTPTEELENGVDNADVNASTNGY